MTTLLLTCRVEDYTTWRPLYEDAISHIPEILTWRVWHGQDDPNFVADHGVSSVQIYFLDADGSGSR